MTIIVAYSNLFARFNLILIVHNGCAIIPCIYSINSQKNKCKNYVRKMQPEKKNCKDYIF